MKISAPGLRWFGMGYCGVICLLFQERGEHFNLLVQTIMSISPQSLLEMPSFVLFCFVLSCSCGGLCAPRREAFCTLEDSTQEEEVC